MEYLPINKYLCKIITNYVDYNPQLLYNLSKQNEHRQFFDITKYSLLDVMTKLCFYGHSGIVIDDFQMKFLDNWIINESEDLLSYCKNGKTYIRFNSSETNDEIEYVSFNIASVMLSMLEQYN